MAVKMENYIKKIRQQAEKAYKIGEVPIGCIIVKNNKIIASAYNKKEKTKLAINHAEIIAIKKASKRLKTWRLDDCIMYVTLEPCMMCRGAINESRIKKVYYLTPKTDRYKENNKNTKFIKLTDDLNEDELLKKFFKNKRKRG